nr:retrotransposon protein, putative, Ty1-copia subclass [Tanacetum cinerariifolium]
MLYGGCGNLGTLAENLSIPLASVPAQAGQQVAPEALAAHAAWVKGSKEIDGLMLMNMEPDIQQNLENLSAYEMLQELKTMFAQQVEQEILQTVRDFHSCKQEEWQFVSSYVLKMKSCVDNLERLGHPVSLKIRVSLILISLRKEFENFVQNYNMHGMGKTVNELHVMLKLHEKTLTKEDLVLYVIRAGKVQKKNNKQKKPQLATKGQNQGKGKNKLTYVPKPKIPPPPKRENSPKDLICHQCGDTVSNNNLVYFSVVSRDGIFEIYLSNYNTNDSSMYAVSNKRAKINLDSALLWHCRLGHISKKRIEKLQHDGLLNSTNLRGFEKCISCMSGKMAQRPYTHQVERAKDLLGLIHTDVCGPFRIVSRQGASYFVTFTNDFSRYSYVYLLNHKHEVFETFKVFQKVVENQLGKTIKLLRSDHGGEYISQEFLDHLKEHEISAHHTSPYMPQHNGVLERRNRTILDMVRSMMSQTTLPKSFWNYALEIVARILNMVPSKKVEKTPYENSLITQEASGSLEDLEIIQEEDTHPFINTSLHLEEHDLEIDKPQSDIIPIRRSTRTCHALDRMCLYVDAEEHELGDLGEPANYKAALLDPDYDKWLDAMNVEI